MKNLDGSGVYIIQCLFNAACYVGQSTDSVITRIGQHISKLIRGCHELPLLQADWDTFGPAGFAIWTRLTTDESLNELEAATTARTNGLEHLGGYNLAVVRDYSYSARIRRTETQLLRSRKFEFLPNTIRSGRINILQVLTFCQSKSNIPMTKLRSTHLRPEALQTTPLFHRSLDGFERIIILPRA